MDKQWTDKIAQKLQDAAVGMQPEESKVQAFFDRREAQEERPTRRLLWVKYAAAISLLVVCGWVIVSMNNVQVSTGNGQTASATLPDGSTIAVGYNTTVSFNKLTWIFNREVALTGEAYFDVESGAKFSVVSTMGTTTVLGTEFNVHAREAYYNVACFEGKVKVRLGDQEATLTPGNGLIQRSAGEISTYQPEGDQPEWLTGEMVFKGESIHEVLNQLEYVYGIEFDRATIDGEEVYTGFFPTNDLEMALELVLIPVGLDFEQDGQTYLLKKSR